MEKKLDSKENPIKYEDLLKKIDERIAQLEKEKFEQNCGAYSKKETKPSIKKNMTIKEFEKRLDEKIAQLEKEENSNK